MKIISKLIVTGSLVAGLLIGYIQWVRQHIIGDGSVQVHGNHDTITVHVNKGAESPSSAAAPPPIVRSDLIIPVETAFLERRELLDKISKHLQGKSGIQAIALTGIVGIGGAGKTTMARYFAKKMQNIPVVWELNAESKETLISSFWNLAYTLANTKDLKKELDFIKQIKEPETQEKLLLTFIKARLKAASEWILLYDNMESFAQINHLFPHNPEQWGNGKVIITTRNEHMIETSYIKPENIIHVDDLKDTEKLILFSRILYDKAPENLSNEDYAKSVGFLKKIPPFPLDVSVAAYSIKNTHVSFEKYINHINEHSDVYDHMQTKVLKETTDYTSTRYGIISSTVEKINKINPNFKALLAFIFFLDSQNISYKLLENFIDTKVLDDLIYNLRKNGLLIKESYSEFNKDNKTISLHRSTQEIGALYLINTFTEKEKEYFIGNMIIAVQSFYKSCAKNNKTNEITLLIPHLMTLLSNIQNISILLDLKDKFETDLYLMLGYINRKFTKNLILAKNYFEIVLQKDNNRYLPPLVLAELLKDLCSIYLTINLLDEGLPYCVKSMNTCKIAPSSGIVMADSFQIIGNYYRKKNDFKNAKDSFEKALSFITKLDSIAARELLAEVYTQLSHLYLMTFLSKQEGKLADEYGKKALEVLEGNKLFYLQSHQPIPSNITCSIARHRWKHSEVFMWHYANYHEAFSDLVEAEYIMKQKCPNDMHLKGRILALSGETMLRQNKLLEAEAKLTEGIDILDVALGINTTWTHVLERAETRIRLGKYDKAYSDCIRIFNIGQIERTNLHDLRYYMAIYHAAFANYKLKDYQKSIEYFISFFQNMDNFCKEFLDSTNYTSLKERGMFTVLPLDGENEIEDIKTYLKRSITIYSTILGAAHPFVKDYVVLNVNQ